MFSRNIPNFLSFLRILLSPLIPFFVLEKFYEVSTFLIIALALTDFLDGYIARRLKAETYLGKFLDPLGDKVFTTFALFTYTFLSDYKLSSYLFFSLLLRDLVLILGGIYLKRYNFIPRPSVFGKITTLLVSSTLSIVAFLNLKPLYHLLPILDFFSLLSLSFVWISFFHYLYKGVAYLKNKT